MVLFLRQPQNYLPAMSHPMLALAFYNYEKLFF